MFLCDLVAMSGESGEQGEKAKEFRAKFGSTTRALDCGCRLRRRSFFFQRRTALYHATETVQKKRRMHWELCPPPFIPDRDEMQ